MKRTGAVPRPHRTPARWGPDGHDQGSASLEFVMTAVAPDPRWPWARRNGAAWRCRRHELAWTKAFPPLAAATSRIDGAIDRLLERLDRGNAYRIVARKER